MTYIDMLHLPVSLLISFFAIKMLIPYLSKLKFGQYVRECGPESHLKKTGTPTMGGIGFLIGLLLTVLIFIWAKPGTWSLLVMIFGFAIIGFLDDYIKVVKKRNLGLKAYQKIILQLVLTGAFITYLMMTVGSEIYIPFSGGTYIDLGWFYIPFVTIVILGTTNGTNLTDGVDGLASSVTIIVASVLTVGDILLGDAVNVGTSLALIGGLLAFLWFNKHPAKVFMGDTGSLALGGYVAGITLINQNPLIIIIVGLVYLVESISVMMQVAYFKKTGKRIFKMAPIHHHFELSGYSEKKVVLLFVLVTVIMGILGVLSIL